ISAIERWPDAGLEKSPCRPIRGEARGLVTRRLGVHRVDRAWRGGDERRVRRAFGRSRDRSGRIPRLQTPRVIGARRGPRILATDAGGGRTGVMETSRVSGSSGPLIPEPTAAERA